MEAYRRTKRSKHEAQPLAASICDSAPRGIHEVLNIEQGTAPFVLCDVGARWAHTYEMRGSEGLPGVLMGWA